MGNTPLLKTSGYMPIVVNPWPINWNSPDLTNELQVAINEWNSVLRYDSFDATTDGINLDINKIKYPNINFSKII